MSGEELQMSEQESLMLRSMETVIFTEQTTFEEVEPYINFEIRLADFVTIFQKQVYRFPHGDENRPSEVEELEEILSNSVLNKQKEVLYSIIYEHKEFLFNVENSS